MRKILYRGLVFGLALMFISSMAYGADPKVATKTTATKATEQKAAGKELIDINTATKEQLRAIPGVGDVYAQKIIDGRPYAKKDQLKSKKILPDSLYDKVKDRIIAKQPPKKK